MENGRAPNSDDRSKSTPELNQASVRREYVIIAAAIVMLLVGLGLLLIELAPGRPLTNKDVLVLGDFTNNTKDPIFDNTLRSVLVIALEQSPFLKIPSDEQMVEEARRLGRPPGTHITNQIAHDICVREHDKAMLSGSITDLGNAYEIALQAVDCQTGSTLARERAEAINKEQVLRALSKVTGAMRSKLGEPQSTVQKYNQGLDQVSTKSLDALQAYARGEDMLNRGETRTAISFFQQSALLDPDFAMAYVGLARACKKSGDHDCNTENIKKAFSRQAKLTERERLSITALYNRVIAGDSQKAIEANQQWAQTYPRDPEPHQQLALIYSLLDETDKQYQEQSRAAALK